MFTFTEAEMLEYRQKYLSPDQPFHIHTFPSKEKRRYFLIQACAHIIEEDRIYNEKEINDVLKQVYSDYVMIRRYLVDYGFINRKNDGSMYWKNKS